MVKIQKIVKKLCTLSDMSVIKRASLDDGNFTITNNLMKYYSPGPI